MNNHLLLITSLIIVSVAGLFQSCNKEDSQTTNNSTEPDGALVIVGYNDYSGYYVVHGNDSRNAMGLVEAIESLFGTKLPTYHFANHQSKKEILVGNVKRKESQDLLSQISGEGYIIKVVDRKLVIIGTDETWTAIALYEFQKKVLMDSSFIQNGALVIPIDFSMKYETSDPQLLAYIINNGYDFILNLTHVLLCPNEGSLDRGQGATSDGSSFYFALKNANDSKARIFKYNISDLNSVGKTGIFDGGHANDMTYNSRNDFLYLAHGHDQGNILTVVSCKTMSVIGDIRIPVGAGAITYNAKRNMYAVSQGGTSLYMLDESFQVLKSFERTPIPGYTAQGMGSDDSYIYFPMSGNSNNILVVYDWSGNYITTVEISAPFESESMFYANDRYYVNFASLGTTLYRLDPVVFFHI